MEVDITREGELDLPAEARGDLDWILAGIHSDFRTDVTARLVRAMEDPHVDAIAHPTGRLIGRRSGYEGLDLETILEAAVRTGTALELNATPERLDLPVDLLRRAVEQGVSIVINSDAKSVEGLETIDLGVSLARRAWVTRESVLNTRPWRSLRKERRERGAGS
jgi:DNA polymerase (family 10)